MFEPVPESRYPCQTKILTVARRAPKDGSWIDEPLPLDHLGDRHELEALLLLPLLQDEVGRRHRVAAIPPHGDAVAVVEEEHVAAFDVPLGLAHDLLGRDALVPVPEH